jgi:hypothetical protein
MLSRVHPFSALQACWNVSGVMQDLDFTVLFARPGMRDSMVLPFIVAVEVISHSPIFMGGTDGAF